MSLSDLARKKGFPPLLRDLVGTRVRLARDARTSQMSIPAGTHMEVTRAATWGLIHLKGDPCGCCGVSPVMNAGVQAIEPIPAESLAVASPAV